jgi:hypothetical protein
MEEETKKQGCLGRTAIVSMASGGAIAVLAIVVVFLIGMSGAGFIIEVPFYLAFGWIFFLKDNLTRMNFGWEMIASSVIGWTFCLWLTHAFCQWVARQKNVAPWRFRQTLRLNILVFLFFAASCALVGCVHQSIWLLTNPVVVARAGGMQKMLDMSNMEQIHHLLLNYENDHGTFPESIQVLLDEGYTTSRENLYAHKRKLTEPYLYFGKGLSTSDQGDRVLLVSPFLHDDRIVYLCIDGSTKEEIFSQSKHGEDQFRQMIQEGHWPTNVAESNK